MAIKLFLTVLLLATHAVATVTCDGSGSSFRGPETSGTEVEFPGQGTVVPESVGIAESATKQPQEASSSDASSAASSEEVPYTSSSSQDSIFVGSESKSDNCVDCTETAASSSGSSTSATVTLAPVASSSSASGSAGTKDEETPINSATVDSSTFQAVESEVCDDSVVDTVYTLYANIRSAFDLCVDASDYQIFPYVGEHPSQTQVQAMAESDACAAVFTVVLQANLSACTLSGMPLVSAVKTLLKIRVDLEQGLEDSGPSAEVFQELLAWCYEVDLAQQAGVPDDSDSELYAEFERNLDLVLENTNIVVNEDLTVDVRLSNGSYMDFEDALDLVVTDASAADLIPGYATISSDDEDPNSNSNDSSSGSTSSSTNKVQAESSGAIPSSSMAVWSLVVAVVTSVFVLSEGMLGW